MAATEMKPGSYIGARVARKEDRKLLTGQSPFAGRGARALLASEKEALTTYVSALGDIDTRAAAVRDTATTIALDKVRDVDPGDYEVSAEATA